MSLSFPGFYVESQADMRVRHLATFRVRAPKSANLSRVIDSSDRQIKWRAVPTVTFRVPVAKLGRVGVVQVHVPRSS